MGADVPLASGLESLLMSMCISPTPRLNVSRPDCFMLKSNSSSPTATATVAVVVTVENIRPVMLRRTIARSVNA